MKVAVNIDSEVASIVQLLSHLIPGAKSPLVSYSMISARWATFSRNTNSSALSVEKSSYLCPFVSEVSSEGNVSEVAEQLMFLYPVHLWRSLLLFGVDLHLFLRCCSTQAYLGKWVRQPPALFVCQLEVLFRTKSELLLCGGLQTVPCMNTYTHLRAQVGACGPDGLCGGAAVDLSVRGAVGH